MSLRLLLAAQLLFVGEVWHDGDLPPRAAGTWLALYDGARPRLAAVPVKTARVHDPIVDEENEPPTGWAVRAPGEPLCLLRGDAGLKAGPIARATIDGRELLPGPRTIKLGAHTWRLVPEGLKAGPEPGATPYYVDGRLVLTDGTIRQVLIDLKGQGEIMAGSWNLSFAGDLDRDGRPDLLMGLKYRMAGPREVLFLSGGAGKGKLVREAAEFTGGGC